MRIALLHSPLVGPTTWSSVASQLRHGGDQVVVPDLRAAVTGHPPYQPAVYREVASALHHVGGAGPLVLVGHSGAGRLLPGVADAVDGSVQALVYVDAGLPRPGTSWAEQAPDELVDHVRTLAASELLPPWDEWFELGAVEELLPSVAVRTRFRRELPQLPLTFLDEPTPPTTWTGPSGYLLLSESYRRDAEEARAVGWPVLEHLSHHLAMLTEPAPVADAVHSLCRFLVKSPGQA